MPCRRVLPGTRAAASHLRDRPPAAPEGPPFRGPLYVCRLCGWTAAVLPGQLYVAPISNFPFDRR
ncbi:unnamed protein product [Ixodes pacificus]